MNSFKELNALTQNCANTFEFSEEDAQRILIDNDDMERILSSEDQRMSLERLHLKETRLLMHSATLSEYWRNKKIPRGLRIQKAPTLGKSDETFKKTWGEILNKCSMDLMLLIIQQTTTEAKEMRAEIETLEEKLKESMGTEFTRMEHAIKDSIARYKEELQAIKLNKYKRDAEDYQKNEIYKWQKKEQTPPLQPARGPLRTRTQETRPPRSTVRAHQRRPGRGYSPLENDFTFDSDSSGPVDAPFLGRGRPFQRGPRPRGQRNAGGGSAQRRPPQAWTQHRTKR